MAQGSGNDVEVKFGAQIDDLKDKLGQVGNLFKELTSRFAAMAAVVAGGAAFKEFIEDADRANAEAEKMSRTLGITAAEAGTIAVAINDVGSELGVAGANADTYTSSFLKFNRMLRMGSEELKSMGVDVDAVKNGQKTSNEVFMEAIKIVGQYKPGIDQTQAAMRLFGRSVQDVQVLMGLTGERMEEARKKQQELNLTITTEGVTAAKNYRMAMNDVGDVMEGLKKTIGEAVMPVFTESAKQLASIGPALVEATSAAVEAFIGIYQTVSETVAAAWSVISEILGAMRDLFQAVLGKDGPGAMQIFKNALAVVQIAFIIVRGAVEEFANAIKTGLALASSYVLQFMEVTDRLLHLDFSGANAAMKRAVADRNRILQDGINAAVEIARKGKADIDKAADNEGPAKQGTPAGAAAGTGGTKTFTIVDKRAQAEADALAAAMLALQKAREQASLASQAEYLREAQSIYDDAYRKNQISTKQYYDATLAIQLQAADAAIAAKQKEEAGAKQAAHDAKTEPEKLKFQAQEAKLAGEINVLEAKRNDTVRQNAAEYLAAEQQRTDALASIRTAQAQTSVNNELAIEKSGLDQLKALRQVSADDAFEIERDLEIRSYGATVAALDAKQQLIHGDLLKQAQLDAEREDAEQQHQGRLIAIDRAAELEKQKYSIQAQQSVQSSFATMVNGLLAGVTKISDVFRQFGVNIANTFTNLIAQRFAERLFGEGTAGGKLISSIVDPVTNAVDMVVRKFITGETTKSAAAVAGAAQRQGVAVAETGTTAALEATKTGTVVAAQAAQTGATVAGAATRTATDVSAAATSTSVTAGTAIANIAAKAWEAAASVYASIASIPYVGPFLAPAMAVAAGAAVLGFASRIASSEGGDAQVAEDRLNFVHKDETILPVSFADPLRKLLASGAGFSAPKLPTSLPASLNAMARINAAASPQNASATQGQTQGRGDTHIYNINVSAIDGQNAKSFLMQHGRTIVTSLQNQGRNFVGLKPT